MDLLDAANEYGEAVCDAVDAGLHPATARAQEAFTELARASLDFYRQRYETKTCSHPPIDELENVACNDCGVLKIDGVLIDKPMTERDRMKQFFYRPPELGDSSDKCAECGAKLPGELRGWNLLCIACCKRRQQ